MSDCYWKWVWIEVLNVGKKLSSFASYCLFTYSSIFFTVIFSILGLIGIICGINPHNHNRDFFTAAGAMFAASALMYSAHCYKSSHREKQSKFYLDQIKQYFNYAIKLLNESGNNNIKWHNAIDSLKTADDLSKQLTERPHQEIYITDFINTAYEIISIIGKIDDFRFFYGKDDYINIDSILLYEQELETCTRISLESISCLRSFIDKASRARFDLHNNKAIAEGVYNSEYFRKALDDSYICSEFSGCKIIGEYISDYTLNRRKHYEAKKNQSNRL